MKGEQKKTVHPFIRISAVDGKELAPGEKKLKKRVKANDLACTLSHIKAIEYAKQQGYDCAIIFEDDIQLGSNFDTALTNLLSKAPEGYSMLFMHGTFGSYNKPKRISNDFWRVFEMYGAFAYLIKRDFYDIAIEELKKFCGILGTDYIYSRLMTRYNIYRADKPIVFHRAGFSYREERVPNGYVHLEKKIND